MKEKNIFYFLKISYNMDRNVVKKIHETVDELALLVEKYYKEGSLDKRLELINTIIKRRTELELYLAELLKL